MTQCERCKRFRSTSALICDECREQPKASPTPNPADLGELVAGLREEADNEWSNGNSALSEMLAKAADALAAQQWEIEGLRKDAWEAIRDLSDKFRGAKARAEALEKERDEARADCNESGSVLLNVSGKALLLEAEVAALKADVSTYADASTEALTEVEVLKVKLDRAAEALGPFSEIFRYRLDDIPQPEDRQVFGDLSISDFRRADTVYAELTQGGGNV